MIRRVLILGLLAMLLGFPAQAQQTMVADLDEKQVQITTDFSGTELLLFGALRLEADDDIAIIVAGPPKPIAVRRKARRFGIWVNTQSAYLASVPSLYYILSTRPIADIATPYTQVIAGLDYRHIPFFSQNSIEHGEVGLWKTALARNMEAQEFWRRESGSVQTLENALFRTDVILPANILPGQYEVRILHFRGGRIVNEDRSTIEVIKSGLSADIYTFAHNYAPFYGIFAIIFAVAAGWLAATLFRR